MTVFYVAIFGVLGVLSRYGVNLLFARMESIFAATLFVNLLGSFLVGFLYIFAAEGMPASVRIGLVVGFLGGFTTFSSYALEAVRLLDSSQYLMAFSYLAGSPILGLIGVFVGMSLGRSFQ